MAGPRAAEPRRSRQFLAACSATAGALLLPLMVAAAPTAAAAPRCDSTEDCLAQMTLEEKAGQMTQVNHSNVMDDKEAIAEYGIGSLLSGGGAGPGGEPGGTAAEWADMYDGYQRAALESRLGIPLIYGVDAVHGHSNVEGATVFPHNIGMGATRNPWLVRRAQNVTRKEVLGTGIDWNFAPAVSVPRDDRWGRTYEGFGEVPHLAGMMGYASIKGLQGHGRGVGSDGVAATAKHYVADGGTAWGTGEGDYMIDQGDAQMSERELRRIHLRPYRAAVRAGAASVMVSFSSWNGLKMHQHEYLVDEVLKGELGFDGVVVSDWAGVRQVEGDSYAEKVRKSVNAGLDMIMVPDDYEQNIEAIVGEVRAGRISEKRIDDAVRRILDLKFDQELFDKPFADRGYTGDVGSAEHRAVAREAVAQSQVLLKNDGVLPLSRNSGKDIVVGGKTADNLGYQLGGWSISWQGSGGDITEGTTLWEAVQQETEGTDTDVRFVGTDTGQDFSGDIGIWVGGETPYAEGFGDDADLALSEADSKQLGDICAKTDVCIAMLVSGRPLIVDEELETADAFVASWLPGSEGAGMTDVLFGHEHFRGRLPVTWPSSVDQEPINRGDGQKPLFRLGYGLRR
ncbi:glycoside hydrolase family 3 protein [Streptomonospora wellingtoniae]|uniref:beta-glucosidase n=1 Tax=Streptomonospora wellingtoniae TaxID=3075544 RepID=A0ABU2L1L9_9ACTN|nr:glycoside hydrolase family 3 protein [Streptomonospora sp. DSM 45055]MDT0305233.1 glycoside hydrolase family 3 protein [Streptomonospora sp. DSM 45055]